MRICLLVCLLLSTLPLGAAEARSPEYAYSAQEIRLIIAAGDAYLSAQPRRGGRFDQDAFAEVYQIRDALIEAGTLTRITVRTTSFIDGWVDPISKQMIARYGKAATLAMHADISADALAEHQELIIASDFLEAIPANALP